MAITIYTKENCSYCVRAKNLMKSRQISFIEVSISEKNIDKLKESFPFMKTLPIIVNDGDLVGGYDSLVEKIATDNNFGKLLLNE